jgi:hypothetical protein
MSRVLGGGRGPVGGEAKFDLNSVKGTVSRDWNGPCIK